MTGSVSNRPRNTPNFVVADAVRSVGVDTLALRGPVTPRTLLQIRNQTWRRVVDPETGEILSDAPRGGLVPLSCGIHLAVDVRRGRPEARFEASIPRLQQGHNCEPASLAVVKQQAQMIYDEGGELVEWECELPDFDVMRVDLPLDFRSSVDPMDLMDLIRALGTVPVSQRLVKRSYIDEDGRGVPSLYRETERWQALLYPKAKALRDSAASAPFGDRPRLLRLAERYGDSLRFEVHLRRDACRARGISSFADLVRADIAAVNRYYFDLTRMGSVVGAGLAKVDNAIRTLTERGEKACLPNLFGHLFLEAISRPSPSSSGTREKYRRLAGEFELLPGDVVEPYRDRMRLDYESATVVLGAEPARP